MDLKSTLFIKVMNNDSYMNGPNTKQVLNNGRLLFAVLAILISIIILGCAAKDGVIARPGFGANRRQLENLTDEQRQQMIEQRTQMMQAACKGKNINEPCEMQSQRGQRAGTCKSMDDKIICVAQMGNFTRLRMPSNSNQ